MNIDELKDYYYPEKKLQSERREIFNCKNSVYMLNEFEIAILFVGDSITERFEVYPYFNKYGVLVNRGIGGEPTSQLKQRLEFDVLSLKPKVCVIAEGVNNLIDLWRVEHNGDVVTEQMKIQTLENYKADMSEMIKTLKANNIIPVVGAVLPIGVKDCRNELIIKENAILKELCEKENVYFADYYSAVVSDDGITMKDYTFGDDLHPHAGGYNQMVKALYPIFDKIFNRIEML